MLFGYMNLLFFVWQNIDSERTVVKPNISIIYLDGMGHKKSFNMLFCTYDRPVADLGCSTPQA